MGNNNEDKGETVQWFAKITLREWSIVISAVGFFYLTIVGGVERLNDTVKRIEETIKEDRVENKTIIQEIRLGQDKMKTEIEVIKIKIQQLEANK